MKRSGGGADDSFGPPLGQRPVWDTNGPDLECDCPGPPPLFHLPPPPRPPSLSGPECSSTSSSETCKALTVIDSEYRYSPAIPSGTVILVTAVAVAVFVFIVTFLVLLKKRRMPGVFGGKASLRTRCDRTSANGVVYEDLPNVRPRTLSPGCPLGQTRLPSIEMIDVSSYTDRLPFTPALIAPAPPPLDPCDAQDMFNPIYEELSNGSAEQPDSNSEDDFAEDELSLGGEGERRPHPPREGGFLRDADSDADDRSNFLGNLPRRACRGPARRANTLDRRKMRPNRTPPPLFAPPADCTELSQGFLLRRILQMYPDVTGVSLEYPRGASGISLREEPPPGGGNYESLPRPKPDIFSTLEKRCMKREGQDSAPGSDSGYSNNTSGGRAGAGGRGEWPVGESGGAMLS